MVHVVREQDRGVLAVVVAVAAGMARPAMSRIRRLAPTI